LKDSRLSIAADPRFSPGRSIVLRYRKSGLQDLPARELAAASLREGARIVPLLEHGGVPIYALDETSLMATHSFEAALAAVTIAHCRRLGHKKIIFSSGGNLGTALAAYARHSRLKACSFNPLDNMPYLDDGIFSQPGICLAGVAEAQQTRAMALRFRLRLRRALGYDPLVPKMEWRFAAFAPRAFFIREFAQARKISFASISQTISAGFGPLAIYRVLRRLPGPLPAFLGVQQAANAYMYRRWSGVKPASNGRLLIPTLFDLNPDRTFGTYAELARVLKASAGAITTVDEAEFGRYISARVLRALARYGLKPTMKGGEPLARSGLVALAGTLKAIDAGILRRGPALVCLTDGVRPPWRPARPAAVIRDGRDLDRLAEKFLEEP